jgi:hypothetical protein
VFSKETPDHVLPQISGNLLRAFVPKADYPVAVDNVHACLQVIQDGSLEFGIV